MDLYHLKTFFFLAKVKNFTKAADLLFVTQSAVSHAIKKLEASVDTKLFKRKGKTFFLTDAGHTLFASCEKIFYEIERADQDIARFKREATVGIRIGSTVEFGTSILINHIRGIINGAIAGLGIGFVPKYTVLRELAEKILIDPFPKIKPGADHFHIFIKREKLAFKKNKALVEYLSLLKPSEFGVD